MYFTDISYVVHPVGRVTPNGVTLLGTAFFINRRGLLATAAHVTGNNDSGLVIVMNKVSSIQDYQDTSDNAIQCIPAKIKEINPIADVCILEVPPVLGTSAPFLAPVIAIVLLTIGKIGLNAWLATRREKREKKSNPEK